MRLIRYSKQACDRGPSITNYSLSIRLLVYPRQHMIKPATNLRKTAVAFLVTLTVFISVLPARASAGVTEDVTFPKIKVLQIEGEDFKTRNASITFGENELSITVPKGKNIAMDYEKIVSAEYSYSKHPRWKTGLELGAAGILFPPLWLVALPLGFTKHRKHWLTVRTEEDFAVIKLRKGNRKLLIPTFETRTGVTVEAVGEDK